jgi:hypothetical protein
LSGHTQLVPLLAVVGLVCSSVGSQAQDAQVRESQAATQPAGPSPLILAEMPPGPVVTLYQNGQLTIEALNASLSDVLRAACNQTGAAIDLPPGADERVVGTFGPGPTQEVLASLLNGSSFNYLMLGSPNDATRLVRLTLSMKPASPLDSRPVRPVGQLMARAAEASPVPQLPPQQATQPSTEPRAPDTQAPPRFPPRRHRRR